MKPYDFPLIMSAPMIQALMRQVRGEPGGKTQTRRLETAILRNAERAEKEGRPLRAWVRETWKPYSIYADMKPRDMPRSTVFFDADNIYAPSNTPWVPAIHMPRWASRLTLLDVSIRRERLGDISEDDARAEGIIHQNVIIDVHCQGGVHQEVRADRYWNGTEPDEHEGHECAADAYAALWDHLHGPDAWDRDADKEVMVLTFRPLLANIDELGADHA